MRRYVLALALVVCPEICLGQQATTTRPVAPASSAPASLPVRRVVLYKTGVGYFEHQGEIKGNQDVTIRFTSRQLNDVLKSLTTIDPKGRINNINYNSAAPLDQRLSALRLPLGPAGTTFDVLASLRGARLAVAARGATPVEGRLLGIERKLVDDGDRKTDVQELSILTDSGVVRSYALSPALGVRVVEREMRQEIGRYLDVIGSTRERDVRNMIISTTGSGARPLFVSYVSEVPVWKSTYRLVIPPTGEPFLQGWAVVDNTIGEDWTSVELSLVAGSPQSFIQQISQPYYVRRPLVPLPRNVLTTPQTHAPGLQATEALMAAARIGGATRDMVEEGVPGGVTGGVVGGPPASRPASPPPPPAPYEQLRNVEPAAQPSDLGDLFQYRIKEPVTLQKDQSALVPIVNASISVEKVSLWNRGAASGHPLRAVWLTNTTGLTLDGGSITVIDGNAFAGEGLVDSLATSAKRLVSYASDLGIVVTGRLQNAPARVSRVRAREGILIHETEERATWSYAIRNEEASPATLIIEHRLRRGWKLATGQTPEEATAESPRFRIPLAPRQETVFVVREALVGESRVQVSEVTDGIVATLSQSGVQAQALLAALKPVLDKKAVLSKLERELSRAGAEQTTIVADQQRLRENMKALRGSTEEKSLLQRYTRTLDEQETKLASLQRSIAQLTAQSEVVRMELDRLVADLAFDISG
jgi:hypothetical protein